MSGDKSNDEQGATGGEGSSVEGTTDEKRGAGEPAKAGAGLKEKYRVGTIHLSEFAYRVPTALPSVAVSDLQVIREILDSEKKSKAYREWERTYDKEVKLYSSHLYENMSNFMFLQALLERTNEATKRKLIFDTLKQYERWNGYSVKGTHFKSDIKVDCVRALELPRYMEGT